MSKPKPIALDQLVQFNLYNPSNPVRGLSPLNAVLSGVKADFKAQQYNEAFFDNGGDPGGTVTTDTLMTSEQIQQYRTQFEDRHVGSDKRDAWPCSLRAGNTSSPGSRIETWSSSNKGNGTGKRL